MTDFIFRSFSDIPHFKNKGKHGFIINDKTLNKKKQTIVCFCCHEFTTRKWNTLDKERVEGLQIKLEQTEYCIVMLHPTSGADNTEVLFLLHPSIMAHRTATTTMHRIHKFHNNYSLIQMNNSNCFVLMYHTRVYFYHFQKDTLLCKMMEKLT